MVEGDRSVVRRLILRYQNSLTTTRIKGSCGEKGFRNPKLATAIMQSYRTNLTTSLKDMAKKQECRYVKKVKKFYQLRAYKTPKMPDRDEKQQKCEQIDSIYIPL